jgi:DNA invertase Pin-like site-specific DNA recombinase
MIAAIYARKEHEARRRREQERPRQIDNARAFAQAKGWTVDEEHVYSDDAISGAETKRLLSRQRMLDLIRSGPPFGALIMRDTTRFSRRDP